YADDAKGNPGLWRENGTAPGIPRIGRQGSGHHTQSAAHISAFRGACSYSREATFQRAGRACTAYIISISSFTVQLCRREI
ncbi:unnamed protein product, partial [Nesidiocoris tenuis]